MANKKFKTMKDVVKNTQVKSDLENTIALASTGAAAGIAVTRLTGYSKTMGAVAGIGMSLLFYAILRVAAKKNL